MRITLVVCAICRSPDRSVTTYRVSAEGRSREAELCDEHAAPLEALLAGDASWLSRQPAPAAPRAAVQKATRGRRGGGREVVTMEQIEAMKKQQSRLK